MILQREVMAPRRRGRSPVLAFLLGALLAVLAWVASRSEPEARADSTGFWGVFGAGGGLTGSTLNGTTANTASIISFNGSNPTWYGKNYWDSAATDCWFDDVRLATGSTQSSVLSEASATTAGTLAYTGGSDKHPGVARCLTAAGATNGCVWHTGAQSYSLSDTDVTTVKAISSLDTLDNGTETLVQEIGAGDGTTPTTQVDGFGFIYTKTTSTMGSAASPNWQIWASKNSVRTFATLDGITTDTVASVVPVGDMSNNTGTIQSFMISGTTARLDFCINDTDTDGYCHAGSTGHVGSACAAGCSMAATSIPASGTTTSGSEWGFLWLHQKLAGTAATIGGFFDGGGICRPFSAAR